MHITRLRAENFKKLTAIDIRPGTSAGIVPIRGRNAQGKSSTLDAIQAALGGKSVMPSRPVRKGEEEGIIILEIDGGELTVRRTFDENGGGQIIVENGDGFRPGSPQKMLDSLYASVAFDPLAFTRMEPKDQAHILRSLVKLDVDPEALEKQNVADYAERRDANRDAKQADTVLLQMASYPDVPAEPLDETALSAKIADAAVHNSDIERRKINRDAASEKADALIEDARINRERAAALIVMAQASEAEAQTLRDRLASADALPEPIDIAEAQAALEDARATNAKIAANNRRRVQEAEVKRLQAHAEALTTAMEERTKQIDEAFQRADMPVPGLTIGDGEVLFNGFPLEQASSAEQLRISTAIGMASAPKLRVMLVRDGSLLDDDGERILAELAEQNGFQLWIEAVDQTGKVGIVLEDGAVVSVDGEPAEAPEPIERARKRAAKPAEEIGQNASNSATESPLEQTEEITETSVESPPDGQGDGATPPPAPSPAPQPESLFD
jgi:hypothetical protein